MRALEIRAAEEGASWGRLPDSDDISWRYQSHDRKAPKSGEVQQPAEEEPDLLPLEQLDSETCSELAMNSMRERLWDAEQLIAAGRASRNSLELMMMTHSGVIGRAETERGMLQRTLVSCKHFLAISLDKSEAG